jgi:ribonuclease Z
LLKLIFFHRRGYYSICIGKTAVLFTGGCEPVLEKSSIRHHPRSTNNSNTSRNYMKPLFHPELVNGVWGDPALYIECLFERRSLLFDLGDLHQLATRKILRLSHVFVSHTHMDHFIGFDWLLRICLGRERKLCVYGPRNIISQVQSKLAGYTWNLVHNYASNFTIEVNEFHPDQTVLRARFCCQQRFQRQDLPELKAENGKLLDENAFEIYATHFDHKIPTLGFALQEKQHVNVWKNRLREMNLPTGPWLKELKEAILSGAPDSQTVRAWWRDSQGFKESFHTLGELKARILRIVPGQKIAYATDLIYHRENKQRVLRLAEGADMFFIEATFLEEDAEHAAHTYHLTARQAGILAREAKVKNMRTFHYSPRYGEHAERFEEQAQRAFLGYGENPDNNR